MKAWNQTIFNYEFPQILTAMVIKDFEANDIEVQGNEANKMAVSDSQQ